MRTETAKFVFMESLPDAGNGFLFFESLYLVTSVLVFNIPVFIYDTFAIHVLRFSF